MSALILTNSSFPSSDLSDQLTRIIRPMFIFLGIISNSLNILVLTRTRFYHQTCSRYFLANAISNLFFSSIILIYRLLADEYQLDPARISIHWCRILVYMNHLGVFLPSSFLILASIDRWCASSSSVQLREFNHLKISRWMIGSTILFCAIFFLNSAITVDLHSTNRFKCSIRADTTYKQIYVILQSLMISLISPCLMTVFGLMMISNIKHRRALPITSNRRTSRQLTRMLLFQIMIYIILCLPSSITYLIFVLPNELKYTSTFFFISMLSLLPLHLSFITPFFLYILSSQIYRKEFYRMILCRTRRITPLIDTHREC